LCRERLFGAWNFILNFAIVGIGYKSAFVFKHDNCRKTEHPLPVQMSAVAGFFSRNPGAQRFEISWKKTMPTVN
jgi:hypothetical protein